MANYILDNSGNISHIKYKGQWVGQVNYKAYGASSPTRLSWAPQHTTVNGWFNNNSYHWQNCDICSWEFGTGTHEGNYNSWSPYSYHDIDANNHAQNRQRACFVCGFTEWDNSVESHFWNIKGAWTYNASDDAKHYRTNGCICGHVGMQDSAAHGGGSTWLNNASKHYHQCPSSPTGCGHVWAVASHAWTSWSSTYTTYSDLQHYNNYHSACDVCSRISFSNALNSHTYAYTSLSRTQHNNHCSLCTWNKLEAHTDGSTWYNNANNHWHKCTQCGNDTSLYAHSSSYHYIDTSYHKHNCDTCGYTFAAQEGHTAGAPWYYNDNRHWHNCTLCGGIITPAAHSITTKYTYSQIAENYIYHYTTENNYCTTLCGYNVVSDPYLEGHSWSSWSNYSPTLHNRRCNDCRLDQYEQHGSWVYKSKNTTDHYKNCGICAYSTTNNHTIVYQNYTSTLHYKNCANGCGYNTTESHSGATSWTTNDYNHWHICSATGCGGIYDLAAHSFSGWSNYNDTLHQRTCGTCLKVNYGAHTLTTAYTYEPRDPDTHYKNGTTTCTIGCGYLLQSYAVEAHSWNTPSEWSSWNYKNEGYHDRYRFYSCTKTGCGYEVVETQSNQHDWTTWSNYTYTSINEFQHLRSRHRSCQVASCAYVNYDNVNLNHDLQDTSWSPWEYKNENGHASYRDRPCYYCTYVKAEERYETHTWSGWSAWSAWISVNSTNHNRQRTNYCTTSSCGYTIYSNETGTHGSWTYSPYNTNNHYKNCGICNYSSIVGHDWSPWSGWSAWTADNSETHSRYNTRYCTQPSCNYTVNSVERDNHSPELEYSYDDDNHWRLCTVCNYQMNFAAHNIVYEDIGSPDNHIKTCYNSTTMFGCGYTVEEGHNWAPNTALDIVEPINATHHGYYYGAYCTNCAYDYIGPKILHLTERHVWSGDRCTICGYTR